jgi:phosphotransferase system  glucose/maltose/N-acetylglucosamine-specific IIC component
VGGLETIGKLLVATGIAFTIVGGLLWAAGRLGFESLPGTLRFGNEQWGCFLPIALSIALSVLLTIVLNVVIRWFGK